MTQPPPQDPQQPPWPPAPQDGPFGHQQPQPQPGAQQQWPPNQQGWPAQPGPNGSNKGLKWALVALALIAIVAVTVAATVLLTRNDSDGPATAGGNSNDPNGSHEIASADDTGPVGIITKEPTCDTWPRIQNSVVDQLGDWSKRDSSVPASQWSPQTRAMFESAANVFRAQADQMVPLAKRTPHRVVRELYEQTIAYYRAYAEAIPNYTPVDNRLAVFANTTSGALNDICGSITYISAASRVALVASAAPPGALAPVGDPADPQRFLTEVNPVCEPWVRLLDRYMVEIEDSALDVGVASAEWTPDVRAEWEALGQQITSYADQIEEMGRSSGNPTLEDFAVFSAQYMRAYVAGIPTYTRADSYLIGVGKTSFGAVASACKALGVT